MVQPSRNIYPCEIVQVLWNRTWKNTALFSNYKSYKWFTSFYKYPHDFASILDVMRYLALCNVYISAGLKCFVSVRFRAYVYISTGLNCFVSVRFRANVYISAGLMWSLSIRFCANVYISAGLKWSVSVRFRFNVYIAADLKWSVFFKHQVLWKPDHAAGPVFTSSPEVVSTI